MQHLHVLEKLNFDLLTSYPGSGGGSWVGGVGIQSAVKIFATMLLRS